MRDNLAERLLAETMKWSAREMADERPYLQAMAAYKYDEYQQFAPGIRFVESLALWLQQFPTLDDRRVAYSFVKTRLIFCSSSEMAHLVRSVFPDVVRPLLLEAAARELGVPKWRVAQIFQSQQYRVLQRKSLFLGLSDGSHIDIFRRSNQAIISNEQIFQSYDVTKRRASALRKELEKDLIKWSATDQEAKFRFVFLLDDFSGSGVSYLRRDEGGAGGKLGKISQAIQQVDEGLGSIVDQANLTVCLVLYVATLKASEALKRDIGLGLVDSNVNWQLRVVQQLDEDARLYLARDGAFMRLCDEFYDQAVETEHFEKGGKSGARLGFAECAIPLIHSHNTPNNAPFLLWSNQDYRIRGLFPRVERHR
jgi:hypothetical protein